MNPPAFIADEVVGAPLDFKWNGPGEHVGPMETVTPLLERIGHKTSCGVWSLGAGVLLWGGWRLKGHAPEADAVIEVAEAMFMHQVDLRYLDRDAGPRVDRPESLPAHAVAKELLYFAWYALSDRHWNKYYQPVTDVFHPTHLVRHILPAAHKKTFAAWLCDDRASRCGRAQTGRALSQEEEF